MKKGIIFVLVLMFTVSWAFAVKSAPIQYDPADYPAPARQGGDTVGDATVIGALPYNDTGSTVGYVDDYDEVCPYTGSTSPDVVYSYTPTEDMINGFVSLCGDTDYDSKLYIYENTVTPGTPYACNDDECVSALGQSYVSELTGLTFTGGNTYYIVVDGYGGNSGNYEIDMTADPNVTTLDPPQNLMVTEDGYATWEAPGAGPGALLEQLPNQVNGLFCDGAYPQVVGENFILTGDTTIEGFVVWGGYYDSNTPVTDDFTVFFHTDAAGAIGTMITTETNVPSTRVQTGVTLFGVDEWMYTLTLATPVDLAAGTYWLEFYNNTQYPTSDVWFWETGNVDPVNGVVGSSWAITAPGSNWSYDAATDLSLQLLGTMDGDNLAIQTPKNTTSKNSMTEMAINSGSHAQMISAISNVPNIAENTRDLLGYNVYLDGAFVEFTTDLFYQYTGLVGGTTYLAEVTALYDDGESDPIGYTFTYPGGGVVLTLPVDEGFEGGTLPDGWTVEYDVGTVDWTFDTGGHSGYPAAAHTGTYNALFYGGSYNGNISWLISPPIDASTVSELDLTFWHAQASWAGDQDELKVHYRLSETDPWIQLEYYTDDLPDWTEHMLNIPDASGTLQIAFEGIDGYGYGVCVDDINIVGSGATFDPPMDVAVDGETGTVSWFAPVTTVIDCNFDSYAVGDYLGIVDPNWTTWTNSPGGADDALISDDYSNSPSNSVNVIENDDLILIMNDYTEGKIAFEMSMYIPTGYCGYFNLQKTSTPGEEWGFQVYYQTDGMAYADMGAEAAYSHPFNHDEWMDVKIIVDLDNDWATYYFNGAEIGGYQWTLGTFGTPGLLQFGGVDVFGGANATQPTDIPLFYIDDVKLSEVQDVTGFNVFLDGVLDGSVGADITEYQYTGLTPETDYVAGVSALYAGGESDVVEVPFYYDPVTTFDPPANPAAAVVDYNDVELTWEAPSGAAEWIRWDSGENGDAIGLTAGGTFYVASRWTPADLADYDGATITKLEYFPNEDATEFIMHVWTGANAGTLVSSETVTAVTPGVFQEIVLSTPVTIDASQELWFGYEVTHEAGGHPAGCDFGPAIAGFGDMISQDGGATWDPLSGFGLDYNWNLAAYVEGADGEAIVLSKPHKTVKAESRSLVTKRNPFDAIATSNRNTRSLAGYKIYQDGVEVGEVTDPATYTYLVESLDAGTYEFTITAFYTNPDGESVPTDPVSATVVLDPPSNGAAQSQPPNIVVTWTAPARGVDSYNVYRDGVLVEEGVSGLMFIDINVPTGDYIYNLTTVYDGGYESEMGPDLPVSHVDANGILLPTVTELTGNYPNPFNPTTTISFSLKEAGHVSINIYNLRGQLVKTLVNADLDRDYHKIVWDGRDNSGKNTSSGVYFYKMKTQNYNSTKKMILMK